MVDQGGYPVTWFVGDTSNFICRICLEVLKKPHQCKSGHNFCLTCIQSIKPNKRSKKLCPLCNANVGITKISANLLVKNLIDDLTVNCACYEDCGWTGPLHKRLNRTCDNDRTKCVGCGLFMSISELRLHQESQCVFELLMMSSNEKTEDQVDRDTQETYSMSLHDGQYSGQLNATNQRHGTGEMRYSDGSKYTGEWADDSRCGQGTVVFADGETYSGDWTDDMRHGSGVMKYANGETYSGCWFEDLRHGQGSQRYVDGTVMFDGVWICDMPDVGVAPTLADMFVARENIDQQPCNTELPRGFRPPPPSQPPPPCYPPPPSQPPPPVVALITNVYVGDVNCLGERHGVGHMQYSWGETYSGEWCGGLRNGHGTATYPSGEVYEGAWLNDVRHGQGTSAYANGDSYSGAWTNGARKGRGTTKYASIGLTIQGVWVNDNQIATEQVVYLDGTVYTGQLDGFLRHGFGEARYTSGALYRGGWLNDLKEGHGVEESRNGSSFVGTWRRGMRHGIGSHQFANGQVTPSKWKWNRRIDRTQKYKK